MEMPVVGVDASGMLDLGGGFSSLLYIFWRRSLDTGFLWKNRKLLQLEM